MGVEPAPVFNIGTVDDRFFSLMAFLHIGIPLFLLLGKAETSAFDKIHD